MLFNTAQIIPSASIAKSPTAFAAKVANKLNVGILVVAVLAFISYSWPLSDKAKPKPELLNPNELISAPDGILIPVFTIELLVGSKYENSGLRLALSKK